MAKLDQEDLVEHRDFELKDCEVNGKPGLVLTINLSVAEALRHNIMKHVYIILTANDYIGIAFNCKRDTKDLITNWEDRLNPFGHKYPAKWGPFVALTNRMADKYLRDHIALNAGKCVCDIIVLCNSGCQCGGT